MSTESEAQEAAEREASAEGGSGPESERAPKSRPDEGVQIPLEQLSGAALHAIVEEFVTRDGTEHTEAGRKIAQVMALLEGGRAEVWFNEKTRTCSILRTD